MELAVSTFGVMLVFVPEEYVSQSSTEEYKADAIVLHDGLEIALLEPSGELLLNDGPRFGYGHIKEAFGCFTIYNEIIRTYHFAIEETVSNLKIYFVHARRKLYNTLNGYLAHLCDSFVVARALFCKAKQRRHQEHLGNESLCVAVEEVVEEDSRHRAGT
ncbi:hypothetical protein RMCBS344292_04470 [Rhizopus microsporus]|nr:hypothetical protein RMCBS344292_04470 [Rhizopus microsporus]